MLKQAKRNRLMLKLKAEIDAKRKRFQQAQLGRRNAVIAARKVLSQLYRLGGVDIAQAFKDFDADNSEELDRCIHRCPPVTVVGLSLGLPGLPDQNVLP